MTILLTASVQMYDVDGHAMFNEELGRTIARDRAHETDTFVRDAALARDAGAGTRGAFLERISRSIVRPWRRHALIVEPSGAFGPASAPDFVMLRDLVDGSPLR
jgi:hypothetical protein